MNIAKKLVIGYIRTKFKILSRLSAAKAAEQAFRLFCTPQSRTTKSLPPIFINAEKLSFSFEGNTVRGFRWNHPSDKKLLILHGFESSIVNFDHYIEPLVKKGYEVLAFDAPAHGISTGRMINVLTYKNMVQYIYEHYGPLQAYLAHSFGGLSVSLALEEIKHTASDKLVLIAPAAETKTAIDHFFSFLSLNGKVRKEFDHLITEFGGREPGWYSVARAASHIKAQVLFLQDKDDELTPLSDVEPIIQKNLPNFRFVISEGLGHSKIYRDNQSMREIMDFL
jgi:pimeloyl-ACP methyl ester carboxylesterase